MRLRRSGLDGHDGTDGRKAFAMKDRRPGVAQALGVQRRAVAFVPVEGVVRSELMVERHACVTEHLGHDGGAGDHVVARIPVNHRMTGHLEGRGGRTVHEDKVRATGEVLHRLPHRLEGRPEDVVAVNLIGGDDADADLGMTEDRLEGCGALAGCELFGICDARGNRQGMQDDGGGDDRSGPRAPPCLVHAGDPLGTGDRAHVVAEAPSEGLSTGALLLARDGGSADSMRVFPMTRRR